MIRMDSKTSFMRTTTRDQTSQPLVGDDVEVDAVVGGVGMVAAAVNVHARGARHRADEARRS